MQCDNVVIPPFGILTGISMKTVDITEMPAFYLPDIFGDRYGENVLKLVNGRYSGEPWSIKIDELQVSPFN